MVFARHFFENGESRRLSAGAGCPSRVVSGVDHELQDLFFGELVLAEAGSAKVRLQLILAPLSGEQRNRDEAPIADGEAFAGSKPSRTGD